MPDREKVIKALELCTSKIETRTQTPCNTCPYHNIIYHGVLGDGCCNEQSLKRDALALLKEDEPLKPKLSESGLLYRCRACGRPLTKYLDKFCPKCGRAVKWE